MSSALKQRHAALDGLRGIAALAVASHHFTMRTDGWGIFSSAQMAVDLFFCLSGLVIAQGYDKRIAAGMSFGDFFMRRVQRLYPLYLLGMVFGLCALLLKYKHGLTDYDAPSIAKAAALNLFYLPYFANFTVEIFQDKVTGVVFPLNGPAWSLFFGFVANVIYFFTVRGGRRMVPTIFVLSGLGFFITAKIYGEGGGWGSDNFIAGFPRITFAFFGGALIYHYREKLRFLPRVPVAAIFITIAALMMVPSFRLHIYYWFVCATLIVPLLVALAQNCSDWSHSRGTKLAIYFGGLSYAMFCLHVPLLSIISTYFAHTIWQTPMVIAGIFGSIALSHLANRLIERPCQDYFATRHLAKA